MKGYYVTSLERLYEILDVARSNGIVYDYYCSEGAVSGYSALVFFPGISNAGCAILRKAFPRLDLN